MIRGISFKIPNKYFKPLAEITRNIDIKKYFWAINNDEVFLDRADSLFEDDNYSGVDFEKIITNNIYYMILCDIWAFFDEGDITEIRDYSDFLQSNCQLVIFCCDAEFVDIYCKNLAELEIIKENAQANHYQDIQYITDENDQRTVFTAFW